MKIPIPAGQETNPDDNGVQEATPTTRTVSVTVTNGQNNIGNATVTIGSVTSQTGPRGGAAELSNISDGQQTIIVTADEYKQATQTVTISSTNTSFEIVLESALHEFIFIDDEEGYNAALADPDSALSKYYAKYPREDGIDEDGHPVRDPDTEVVGHSWEAAITAPTDPAQTSSFPWIGVSMDHYTGKITFKYNDETKLEWDANDKSFVIMSVPNDLGMTDYRLEWGTGNKTGQTFNPNLLKVIFE